LNIFIHKIYKETKTIRLGLNVFISLAIAVSIFELYLRYYDKRYQNIAAVKLFEHYERIFSTKGNTQFEYKHPDKNKKHLVKINNVGGRQSRNFKISKGDNIRIGIFGDSFVANYGMENQYSLTEPLDYLLNLNKDHNYQVINFGVNGYGTDQEYFHYLEHENLDLDIVIVIMYANDIKNIYANKLFEVNKEGELKIKPTKHYNYNDYINKLHISYYIIELYNKIKIKMPVNLEEIIYIFNPSTSIEIKTNEPLPGEISYNFYHNIYDKHVEKTKILLESILSAFNNKVKDNNGTFLISYTPFNPGSSYFRKLKNKFKLIDIEEHLEKRNLNINDIKFKNDGHWNELANKHAAIAIYKYLIKTNLVNHDDNLNIDRELHDYYDAFNKKLILKKTNSKDLYEKFSFIIKKYKN
jgi:hypothetical protein